MWLDIKILQQRRRCPVDDAYGLQVKMKNAFRIETPSVFLPEVKKKAYLLAAATEQNVDISDECKWYS